MSARQHRRKDGPAAHNAISGVVFLAGAGVYALLQSSGITDFDTTPLSVGIIAILAGLLSSRQRAIATGLVLAGWGTAVLLVANEVVPAPRTTPAYMLGIGVGLLLAALLAPEAHRGDWLTSGAIAAAFGPLGLFLSYDVSSLGRWPAWALTLVALAVWELFWGMVPRSGAGGTGRAVVSESQA